MQTKHLKNVITTTHELVFGWKVSYTSLFPMFCVAYVKISKHRQEDNTKWTSTLKTIMVSRCPKLDGLLSYIPQLKQLISSDEGYKFDTSPPSGLHFNKKYDFSFHLASRASTEMTINRLPPYKQKDATYMVQDNKADKVHVLE